MKFRLSMRMLVAVLGCAVCAPAAFAQNAASAAPAQPGFTLMTPAFEDGAVIPAKYTQSVSNFVSPKLEWGHVPAGTVSFTLIVHDVNNPVSHTTDDSLHWLAFNIPGSARELPEGVPVGAHYGAEIIQLQTTHGGVGYNGPGAPAPGPYHHYSFELYALDTKLSLDTNATRADVMKAMEGHVLGKGVVVGRFHR